MQNNDEIKNSEILFIYDAKEDNPNGDPDNENKPRMDLKTQRNLVTDVRLKRYIRNYLQSNGDPIFVSKVDGKTVDATGRFAHFLSERALANNSDILKEASKKLKKKDDEITSDELAKFIEGNKKWELATTDDLLNTFIDIRLFGITLPIKDPQRGSSITFTGPAQFTWGYSLNKVELMDSTSITSTFAGRTKGVDDEGGAIGKDWRLYYSFIAFYGRISGNNTSTSLSKSDIQELDKAIWQSIIEQTNTRTKINQMPRLYLRVEYNDSETCIGDLRRYIKLENEKDLRDINEVILDTTELLDKLSSETYKQKINKILFKQHEDLVIKGGGIDQLLNKRRLDGKSEECK